MGDHDSYSDRSRFRVQGECTEWERRHSVVRPGRAATLPYWPCPEMSPAKLASLIRTPHGEDRPEMRPAFRSRLTAPGSRSYVRTHRWFGGVYDPPIGVRDTHLCCLVVLAAVGS